jgi:hypothetical protein
MILPISEMLAILPYLLRSLRIQKMFEAREIYCNEERIPKKMIWQWKEGRLTKILIPTVLIVGGGVVAAGYMRLKVVNYNSLSAPMQNDALFSDSKFSEIMGYRNAVRSTVSFCEYILLCWALHAQWYIEKEYNIFIEIFLVAINWFLCNTVMNYLWIFDKNLFGIILNSNSLPLNELRWADFITLTIRSLGCIFISSLFNIKASFK